MEEAIAIAKPEVIITQLLPPPELSWAKTGEATHKASVVSNANAENRLTIFSPFS